MYSAYPNGKDIIVAQDMLTHFPAVKTERRINAKEVLPSLFIFLHNFVTLYVDFIRIYLKFYAGISLKLITFTSWNEFNIYRKLIFDCKKDENTQSESFKYNFML